jgi:microsomal dipeptidase-like Zn-dependent dipeptidase
MNRREFLKYSGALCAAVAFGKTPAFGAWQEGAKRCGFPMGMMLIDAHAHPDIFPCTDYFCDQASTIKKIKQVGMNASCFAVVGDAQLKNTSTDEVVRHDYLFSEVLNNLAFVQKFVDEGDVKLVKKWKDIPNYNQSLKFKPGAIFALEGAIPLAKNMDGTMITDLKEIASRVDTLHDMGVRIITLMHFWSNELGGVMTDTQINPDSPTEGHLTPSGQAIVERMMKKKMIVDVAHAHKNTLEDIAALAIRHRVPIIDSHTALSHQPIAVSRRRTLDEMETIAETSGVVCTWPVQACKGDQCARTSFEDWADETVEIASAIGIEHVGLGTDGGGVGNLAKLIDGYESILDLPKLVEAMEEAGLKRREIAAYMGENIKAVIKKCIG